MTEVNQITANPARFFEASNRSTLAKWVGGASWWLEVLRERLAAHLFASGKLFADDTPIPVLDPGRGRTRTGRLWVYVRDDRPWAGPDPPAAVYFYSPDRRAERPAAHLSSFRGTLQVDGYAGFEMLAGGGIVLAACWAHARRKFYDVHQATGSPIAAEALRRIAELYAIENDTRGRSADARQGVRDTRSRPLVEVMKLWLEDQLQRVPPRGGLAEVTPATAAGVTDRLWELEKLIRITDEMFPAPEKRGPYKKRATQPQISN